MAIALLRRKGSKFEGGGWRAKISHRRCGPAVSWPLSQTHRLTATLSHQNSSLLGPNKQNAHKSTAGLTTAQISRKIHKASCIGHLRGMLHSLAGRIASCGKRTTNPSLYSPTCHPVSALKHRVVAGTKPSLGFCHPSVRHLRTICATNFNILISMTVPAESFSAPAQVVSCHGMVRIPSCV
jgi:hypothetical protein